MHVGRSR